MIVVVVNRRADLAGAATTRRLVERLERRGPVQVVEVGELGLGPGEQVLAGDTALRLGDRVLLRTNPARAESDLDQRLALDLLGMAQRQGVVVMNEPQALARAMTKLYLSTLPADLVPRTLISRDVKRLRAFVAQAPGRTVVKPVSGTRGRDVFLLSQQTENLSQILDVVARQGLAMIQDFVPEAVQGDTRVVVLGGRILERDGHLCAVRRIPPHHDFRSNVAIGGKAAPAQLSDEVVELAHRAAAHLLADGIALAGLDVIGHKLVEVNVFATGGLPDAGSFSGVDFVEPVLDYFLGLQVPKPLEVAEGL